MSKFSNIVNFVKGHAKEIGIVASSAAAFAATAVSVSKVVVKVDEVKKEYEKHVEDVKIVLADENIPESKYSQEDAENDIRILKTQRIVNSVSAFLPTAAVIGGSFVVNCALGTPIIVISAMLGGTAGAMYKSLKNPNTTKEEKKKTFIGSIVISAISFLSISAMNIIRTSTKNVAEGVTVDG